MPLTVLEVATPQCVAEEFDGEIVALNMDTGTYFSIKDAGARLWHDLAAGHAVEQLVERAGGGTALGAAIGRFADTACAEGLMRPRTSEAVAGEPGIFTPSSDGADLPVLEAFHDMQSLLLLDPVHEVDEEEGWPKTPSA